MLLFTADGRVLLQRRAAEKYHDYRGITPAAREFARSHDFGRAIVLVRGRRQPDYHLASLENPLDLRSDATIS